MSLQTCRRACHLSLLANRCSLVGRGGGSREKACGGDAAVFRRRPGGGAAAVRSHRLVSGALCIFTSWLSLHVKFRFQWHRMKLLLSVLFQTAAEQRSRWKEPFIPS